MFLDWLFYGQAKIGNETKFVRDLIMEKSGYIVPIKEMVSQEKLTEVKTKISSLNVQIQTIAKKADASDDDKKLMYKLETTRNYFITAQISLQSLLKFTESNDIISTTIYLDEDSSKLNDLLRTSLESLTNEGSAKVELNGQEALKKFLSAIKNS
ncbi:hypothetical protein [Mycoplasmopsis alligatoris]|uniref:Conserved domain protein n=1 Tax=Mycoplasmopsis alligatoris A21JP2 TaxID=747682 RepID=D4XV50_9BACT|nr:hypothetical protein [Mycoplasmopsis alligatoris]EFF41788.1 conserved domain protein [Mycoplasmopsis alligatoris A21JP2]